jgi:hypothetical protein
MNPGPITTPSPSRLTQNTHTMSPAHQHTTSPGDPDDLADLETLTTELNAQGKCTALLLTPPRKPPYIDVSLPADMTAGERIYAQAGTYFWHSHPIGPTSKPHTAATTIAHTLQTAPGHADTHHPPTTSETTT